MYTDLYTAVHRSVFEHSWKNCVLYTDLCSVPNPDPRAWVLNTVRTQLYTARTQLYTARTQLYTLRTQLYTARTQLYTVRTQSCVRQKKTEHSNKTNTALCSEHSPNTAVHSPNTAVHSPNTAVHRSVHSCTQLNTVNCVRKNNKFFVPNTVRTQSEHSTVLKLCWCTVH